MPKTNIEDILKRGAKCKFNTVDYSSPNKKKELQKLKEDQDARERARKNISIESITRLYGSLKS